MTFAPTVRGPNGGVTLSPVTFEPAPESTLPSNIPSSLPSLIPSLVPSVVPALRGTQSNVLIDEKTEN